MVSEQGSPDGIPRRVPPGDGDHDVRLIALDPWERQWIAGAVQHALNAMRPGDAYEFRLRDLLSKMRRP